MSSAGSRDTLERIARHSRVVVVRLSSAGETRRWLTGVTVRPS
ncbi:hypothetical protein [Microtetraspora sp. NBRC 16547]|nr:hypothetical protein [Microtetraspora sp. NBRC 16547]